MEEDEQEIFGIEDIWSVIGAFFNEKGLVFQQIDSFNMFIKRSIQNHLKEHTAIQLIPNDQLIPGDAPVKDV